MNDRSRGGHVGHTTGPHEGTEVRSTAQHVSASRLTHAAPGRATALWSGERRGRCVGSELLQRPGPWNRGHSVPEGPGPGDTWRKRASTFLGTEPRG